MSRPPIPLILAFLTFLGPSAALCQQTPEVDAGLLSTATAKADAFLRQRFHKCGEDSFSQSTHPAEGFTPANPDLDTLYQYKGWNWHLEPQSVSEAEKLNGTEWNAQIVINFRLIREYVQTGGDGFHHPHWIGWSENYSPIKISQRLSGGAWTMVDETRIEHEWVAPSCADVAKLLAAAQPETPQSQ